MNSTCEAETRSARALAPYPVYKDSGVEWLGMVPEHWDLRRMKTLLLKRNEKGHPNEPLLAATQTKGVVRKEHYENRTVLPMKDLHLLKLVHVDDFVISLRSFQGGIENARHRGIISPAYTVLYPACPEHHGYLAHLFKSAPYIQNLSLFVTGIRQGQNIDYEKLSRSLLPIPPLAEQAAIVRFLNRADRRIRRYIRAKERLIELLEEHKKATIHEAVTGQIDVRTGQPYPAYKDSGTEWIGRTPASWDVCTLGRIAESFRTGPFGSTLHQSDYVENGTPVINPIHMKNGAIFEDPSCSVPKTVAERLSRYRLCLHDLVFARRGELGRCAIVRSREVGWILGTGSIRVRVARKHIVPKFLIQTLQVRWVSEFLSLSSVGATMDNLNTSILKRVPLPLPPIQQQQDIVDYIGHRIAKFDYAIKNSKEEICLVREYRTRLIADIVTGKLDVRSAAAGLSEIDPVRAEDDLDDGKGVSRR